MRAGQSYGGKEPFIGKEKVLSPTGFEKNPTLPSGKKLTGWAGRWAKIKSDPLLLAAHKAKLKEGLARFHAQKRLKAMKKEPS